MPRKVERAQSVQRKRDLFLFSLTALHTCRVLRRALIPGLAREYRWQSLPMRWMAEGLEWHPAKRPRQQIQ